MISKIYLFGMISFILFILWFSCVISEIVRYRLCDTSKYCKLLNVSVNPCPEAKFNLPCKAFRGKNLTWSFTFIPQFSGREGTLRILSAVHVFDNIDVANPTQDRNACRYTKCPFEEGALRTLSYTTPISPSYPTWPMRIKWRLWNEKKQDCCFMYDIEIRD